MELKLRHGMLMVLMLAEAKINPSVVRKEPVLQHGSFGRR
jgi:hypothetical protein